MFNIHDINISFSFSTILFILGALLISAYTIYSYRYTTPPAAQTFKLILIIIRTTVLFLVLFTIFEPILSFSKKETIKSKTLIYIDDSKSIVNKNAETRREELLESLDQIKKSRIADIAEFFTFGKRVRAVSKDSLSLISNSESVTNFSDIFNTIKNKEEDLSSIIILSDGVITDGPNPLYTADKLGIPVYTLGIGDTDKPNNIQVSRVLFNEYIYAETPTIINASILNKGFNGRMVKASLYEENKLIDQNTLALSDEVNSFNFNYNPGKPGEKKMTITLDNLPGEATFADNKYTFYINVLNNKLRVLVLSGTPSADLSFIRSTLASDENLKVSSITQINSSRFVEPLNQNRIVDSSDLFFLIGFPAKNTPEALYNRIVNEISVKNKPFFFILGDGTDLNKLKRLQSDLPFLFQQRTGGYNEVQPLVDPGDYQDPLLQNNAPDPVEAWNNLPPVYRLNNDFTAKAESRILSSIKINNIPINSPLILTRKMGSKRSIAVIAKDIWRWKLQISQRKLDLYDNFILNSVKWLNTREDQKRVTIKTSKKTYSIGEPVEFSAQVYDETFNPLNDADVELNIISGQDKYSIHLNGIGNGIYEGTLITSKSGDYQFSGNVKLDNKELGVDNGKFTIGDIEIEMLNTSMDKNFLTLLASQTDGRFFRITETGKLIDLLEKQQFSMGKEKKIKSQVLLWSNEWILIIIIVLFALEWFLRKRAGMV